MKKRSMLAFASLATGVVLSLASPQTHAAAPDSGPGDTHAVDHTGTVDGHHPVVEEPSADTTRH